MMQIMSSSTSSSSQAGRAALITFVGVALGLLALIAMTLVLLDPYDTGRITPFRKAGVPETGPRMTNASRMRNPEFNAAIFGNSTIQLVSPERLNAATGNRFVQLSVPGTGPMEQAAMIKYLVHRRGDSIRTIVLGLEQYWCDLWREQKTSNPFPFWLYDRSAMGYLSGLFRMDSIEFAPQRIKFLFGQKKQARQDGYWDYDVPGVFNRVVVEALVVPRIPAPTLGQDAAAGTLEAILKAIPAATSVILVHPPVFSRGATPEAIADAPALARCKAALAAVAAKRPQTALLDLWIDSEDNRTRSLFFDHNHYRTEMARRIEAKLVELLAKMTDPKP
jgi:hypothetical protein